MLFPIVEKTQLYFSVNGMARLFGLAILMASQAMRHIFSESLAMTPTQLQGLQVCFCFAILMPALIPVLLWVLPGRTHASKVC